MFCWWLTAQSNPQIMGYQGGDDGTRRMNENHSVTDRTLDLPLGRGEMLPFVREMVAYVCHCCCWCLGDSTVRKGVLG